jgi:hypothetical protein
LTPSHLKEDNVLPLTWDAAPVETRLSCYDAAGVYWLWIISPKPSGGSDQPCHRNFEEDYKLVWLRSRKFAFPTVT